MLPNKDHLIKKSLKKKKKINFQTTWIFLFLSRGSSWCYVFMQAVIPLRASSCLKRFKSLPQDEKYLNINPFFWVEVIWKLAQDKSMDTNVYSNFCPRHRVYDADQRRAMSMSALAQVCWGTCSSSIQCLIWAQACKTRSWLKGSLVVMAFFTAVLN